MQPKTKVERPKTIGGSDAVRIMEGDWHTLWKEKTGRQEPEDLSWVLPVQIGILTEKKNKEWFEHISVILTFPGHLEFLGPIWNFAIHFALFE